MIKAVLRRGGAAAVVAALTVHEPSHGRTVLPGCGVIPGATNLRFHLALARLPLGIAVTDIEFLGPPKTALIGLVVLRESPHWAAVGRSPVRGRRIGGRRTRHLPGGVTAGGSGSPHRVPDNAHPRAHTHRNQRFAPLLEDETYR
jgi:hypothetical protein